MNDQEALAQLQTIFDGLFMEPVTLSRELSADDVEEWDSVTNVHLVLSIEQSFGTRFKTGQFESFQNIGDLVDFLKSAQK